jgi:hypothetical protein
MDESKTRGCSPGSGLGYLPVPNSRIRKVKEYHVKR